MTIDSKARFLAKKKTAKKKTTRRSSGGRPKKAVDIRQVEILTRAEVASAVSVALKKRPDELDARIMEPDCSALEAAVLMCLKRAIEQPKGDIYRLNALLDRVVGKPTDSIDRSFSKLETVPTEELLKHAAKLAKELKK